MAQLTEQEIAVIRAEVEDERAGGPTAWYSYAPDGAYDFSKFHIRYFIVKGFPFLVASREWVNDPVANQRLSEWMRAPWGTYPDIPAKPKS